MEDYKKKSVVDGDKEIVFSKAIKAGKRIYYLDVKKNRKDEMFLAITESKKIVSGEGDDSQVSFEKHKIFLYKEDFEKFMNGLQQAIQFIAEDQPLLDTHGNPVGAIAGSDFVDSISDVNSYEKVELTLYFANEEKDGLVAEKREVFHSMNTSLERLVVEQLLAGSQNGGLSVMPKNTKVLNVSLTDNTCYVNLDSGFISGDIDVAEYIPIYAIVDSLTELQTVNKVQITVNGSADVTYRNVISLVQPLEREEKYIVK